MGNEFREVIWGLIKQALVGHRKDLAFTMSEMRH